MNRVTIFVGEFGSGKTELSMNYSLYLKHHNLNTAIVDIDLVKPYFRTRENAEMLEAAGVKVVTPEKRLAHSDLPVLPVELMKVLSDETYHVVMDVGGGESAIVLGQYRQKLQEFNPEIMMVVNTRRPFTSSEEGIIGTLKRIEQASGLTVTSLVSNTNLGCETTEQHVVEGAILVSKVAQILGLTVKYTAVPYWLEGKVQVNTPIFILQPYTQYPWMG